MRARPAHTRPLTPGVVAGARHSPPFGRASTNYTLKCPCDILPSALVFDNRGNGSDAYVCSPSVMSIAVEKKRILTAKRSRTDILLVFTSSGKSFVRLCSSGGVS